MQPSQFLVMVWVLVPSSASASLYCAPLHRQHDRFPPSETLRSAGLLLTFRRWASCKSTCVFVGLGLQYWVTYSYSQDGCSDSWQQGTVCEREKQDGNTGEEKASEGEKRTTTEAGS